MPRLIRAPRARRDIAEVVQFTRKRWGDLQAKVYGKLIRDALATIAADPTRGKAKSAARPGILAFHIGQAGGPGRHVLFYRVDATGAVEIVRLLHDAMDIDRHIP